jgi:naphthoate synthase/2-ketocyclohexanecarboxyl-CoA hydrolase
MFRAFYDADHDPAVGVVVIAGAGKHFGTGGDVDWERWGLREAFYNRYPHNRLIRLSRKPVIAQVQGYCIGGHNHMAYCCDFTIAADNAVFGQAGPRVSSPADGYFVPFLTKVVGHKKAREMWMLCRRYTAKQMLDWGLVNAVVPMAELDAEVARWCKELLALSPTCLKTVKTSFNKIIDLTPMKDILAEVAPNYFRTGEQDEGARAFIEKRPPDFSKWR